MGPSTHSFGWAIFFGLSTIMGLALLAASYTNTGTVVLLGAGLLTFLHFLIVFVERRVGRSQIREETNRSSDRQVENLKNLNTAERPISSRKE